MSNAPSGKKKIIIGIICVIVLLNVVWTVMQNKITPQFDALKAQMQAGLEALDQRITKLEKGGLPDVAELKADFAALRGIADNLGQSVKASLKTEEERLAVLEAQVEALRERRLQVGVTRCLAQRVGIIVDHEQLVD